MGKMYRLQQMNLELTTACPLRCPQCYCTLEGGRHLDLEIAKKRIDEAVDLGLETLNLSGGETMCYPHLYELIRYASSRVNYVDVALSGALFDQDAFEKLEDAGIAAVSVSLNGSSEEVNCLSRSGYAYGIQALSLLKRNSYRHTTINWVMHSTNAEDFPNLIKLAEEYNVQTIDIISLKPDAQNALSTFPTMQQIEKLSRVIKHYSGPVRIAIEGCFSNFLAYHMDTKLFGNLNVGQRKGCMAGRDGISVNVDGAFTPCRHIEVVENFDSMKDYWEHSQMLQRLRQVESDRREPCFSCKYAEYCRHCQAISWQTHEELFLGFSGCPVYTEKTAKY